MSENPTPLLLAVVLLLPLSGCELLAGPQWTVEFLSSDVEVPRFVTIQLEATAWERDRGAGVLSTADLDWVSSDPAVAAIVGPGLVEGVTLGVATITAEKNGGRAAIEVTVVEPAYCADQPGIGHAGEEGSGTWRAALHVLTDTVVVPELEIQDGATICGHPGATLEVGRLTAVGADFTATDPALGWGGIRGERFPGVDSTVELTGALIEFADIGIAGASIRLQDVVIRQTRGPALIPAAFSGLSADGVRIDTACIDSSACTAVTGGDATVTDIAIRGSGGDGLYVGDQFCLTASDLTIEESDGTGLSLGRYPYGGCLEVSGAIRLTGNEYPASVGAADVPKLMPTPEAVGNFLGNRRDTLKVTLAYNPAHDATVHADLPWRITVGGWLDTLVLEPGATMSADLGAPEFRDPNPPDGHYVATTLLRANGTEELPITLDGIGLSADAIDTSHVRLVNGAQVVLSSDTGG